MIKLISFRGYEEDTLIRKSETPKTTVDYDLYRAAQIQNVSPESFILIGQNDIDNAVNGTLRDGTVIRSTDTFLSVNSEVKFPEISGNTIIESVRKGKWVTNATDDSKIAEVLKNIHSKLLNIAANFKK